MNQTCEFLSMITFHLFMFELNVSQMCFIFQFYFHRKRFRWIVDQLFYQYLGIYSRLQLFLICSAIVLYLQVFYLFACEFIINVILMKYYLYLVIIDVYIFVPYIQKRYTLVYIIYRLYIDTNFLVRNFIHFYIFLTNTCTYFCTNTCVY